MEFTVHYALKLTDSHSLDHCVVKNFEQCSYTSNANHRIRELFRLRRPYWPQADIVNAFLYGFLDMLNCIASHTDDGVRGQQPARNFDGHVGLTKVHTIGTDRKGNVDTVVDEDGNVVPATDLLGCLSDAEELWESINKDT